MSPWCILATCPLFQAIVTASQVVSGRPNKLGMQPFPQRQIEVCCGVALHVIKMRRQFFGGQVVKIEKYRPKIGNPIPSEGPLLFSRNAQHQWPPLNLTNQRRYVGAHPLEVINSRQIGRYPMHRHGHACRLVSSANLQRRAAFWAPGAVFC